MKKREFLNATAAMGAATVAACAAPGTTVAQGDKVLFAQKPSLVPVMGGYGWLIVAPAGTTWMASVGFWKKNGGSRVGSLPISRACAA